MTFTPTPPTKPGYFLFKHSEKDNYPFPVRVAYDDLGGLVCYQGNWCKITELNGLWSPRLVPVDEVEKAWREGYDTALSNHSISNQSVNDNKQKP